MANRFYPLGAQKILSGAINFTTDTIKAALVSNGYAFSAAHEFLSSISTNVVGTAQTLANKTIDGGVLDADDPAFGAVASGPTVRYLVLYKDTGNAATSPLLALLDEVTGFPFAANGSDVDVAWSGSAARIISLV